jgi:hypothetical protein
MVYACDINNVYLTNPLETKSIETIMNELTSESVLLVRCYDVIKRFSANNSNLIDLISLSGFSSDERKRWLDMNVIGQVLSILREHKANQESNGGVSRGVGGGGGVFLLDELNDVANSQSSGSSESVNSMLNSAVLIHSVENGGGGGGVNQSLNLKHITIPASYKSGITLFAYKDSELFKEILEAKELPIIQKN